ncbi:MAG: holo-ACP synthase [Akkermansia sp.]
MSYIIGLGIDLVDLDRIARICTKGSQFAERICTPQEWLYCASLADPVPSLAARLAAKEAVSKALGTGLGAQCGIREIEVILSDLGAPSLVLHGKAAETAKKLGITSWSLSLTHSRVSAAAVVIASGENA